jgi:hypothetical protein
MKKISDVAASRLEVAVLEPIDPIPDDAGAEAEDNATPLVDPTPSVTRDRRRPRPSGRPRTRRDR